MTCQCRLVMEGFMMSEWSDESVWGDRKNQEWLFGCGNLGEAWGSVVAAGLGSGFSGGRKWLEWVEGKGGERE